MAFLGILPRQEGFGERLAKGVGEGLSKGLDTAATRLAEHHKQKKGAEYFSGLAKENPDNPTYQLLDKIYASPLGSNEKSNLVKQLIGSHDPYRALQQERLSADSLSRRYNQAISEIDNGLKSGSFRFGTPEHKEAIEMRHRLAQERDQLMGFAKRQEPEIAEDEDVEEERFERHEAAPKKAKKERFDPRNPKHKARRDEVLRKTGGDKAKAGMVLSKEFDL